MKFNLKKLSVKSTLLAAALAFSATVGFAQELPKPGPEHAWLQQEVGEWDVETEIYMEPGKPPVVVKGTESIHPVGGFWTVSKIQSTMMDQPFTGMMTLGYDTDKKKYVAIWVDSMTGQLWTYEGTVDASGKILTLETRGKCPIMGKELNFKEMIEIKDQDHKVFTSMMQGEDGKWVTALVARATRKK